MQRWEQLCQAQGYVTVEKGQFLLFNTTYRKAGGKVCGPKGIWASGRSWHHVSELFSFLGPLVPLEEQMWVQKQ